ncbi:MAG: type II toxin-antitoxin system RelE/ParE family toxin [Bacteroidota bacterium]
MTRIQFTAEAREDIQNAFRWYEDQQPGLGSDFLLELDSLIEQIETHPTRYPVVYHKKRRLLFQRFSSFSVIYEIHHDEVFVIAVAHSSQDPTNWQER